MSGNSPWNPIFLVFMASVVALFVGGYLLLCVLRWMAQRMKRLNDRLHIEPRCGNCDYIVLGRSGHHCPECGADLNVVGIITSRFQRRNKYVRPAAWTIAIAFLAFWSYDDVVVNGGPRASVLMVGVELTGPESQNYLSARIYRKDIEDRSGRYSPVDPFEERELVIVDLFDLNGNQFTLQIDRNTHEWRHEQDNGMLELDESPLNPQVVLNWMSSIGVRTDDPSVVLEATQIGYITDAKIKDRSYHIVSKLYPNYSRFSSIGNHVSGDLLEPHWWLPLVISFWLAIWIAGLAFVRFLGRVERHAKTVAQRMIP